MTTEDFPPPYTGSDVYHYTDAGGLIGMVENHTLRATDSSGMNDPREGLYGEERLDLYQPSSEDRETFEHHRWRTGMNLVNEVFVACASTERDDVSQWMRYTPWPDVGYSIGLAPGTPLGIARQYPLVEQKGPSMAALFDVARTSRWSAVIYGPQQFNEAAARLVPWGDALVDRARQQVTSDDDSCVQEAEDSVTTSLSDLTRLAKDAGFASEKEVRIVSSVVTPGKYIQSRASRYGVVRYVELVAGEQKRGFVMRDEKKNDSWKRLPITSVTIGPSPYAERGVRAVRGLLLENGYDGVSVHVSDCQMR